MDGFHTVRISHVTLVAVLLAHVGLVYGLASSQRASMPEELEHVIQMSLVQPEKPAQPEPVPPKPIPPKVVKKAVITPPPKVVEPPPIAVAQAAESTRAVPVVEEPPKPVPVAEPVVAAAAPVPVVEAPPIEPPKFNADYLDNPSPVYPVVSRRMGEVGRVLLRVQVSEKGLPSRVLVKKTSGYERLDEAALDTVRNWKFVPAQQGGKPVEAWVVVPITFDLKG